MEKMARPLQHVSLKQPFAISSLENMEVFFDGFAKELCLFDIEFVDIDIFPFNVLGEVEFGCISLQVKETQQLVDAQKRSNEELYKVFGPYPAKYDNDYIFHMTFAIGSADYAETN